MSIGGTTSPTPTARGNRLPKATCDRSTKNMKNVCSARHTLMVMRPTANTKCVFLADLG